MAPGRPGPRLGEGGTRKPPRQHFLSALHFLGKSTVSGWVHLLCVKTTEFGHTQRRLVEGGQSQALGDKDSACCFQRLSQLSKWNICIKFSRRDEILRRTNSRKRHEWKGERRYKKTQYGLFLNPTSRLFPRSNIPGEGKLEESILRGKKPRWPRLFGEREPKFSSQPAA